MGALAGWAARTLLQIAVQPPQRACCAGERRSLTTRHGTAGGWITVTLCVRPRAVQVMPKSYGQRLPWWFVFDARYWTRNVRRTNRRRRGRSMSQPPDGGGAAAGALTPLLPRGASADGRSANGGDTDDDDRVGGGAGDSADVFAGGAAGDRAAGAGAGAAVEVRGLCKEFPTPAGGGVKVAVDHLDLRVREGGNGREGWGQRCTRGPESE